MERQFEFVDGSSYLAHFGTKGQRWGFRRYQNEDGSLTEEGKARRAKLLKKSEKYEKKLNRLAPKIEKQMGRNLRKATKMQEKAAKYKRKSRGLFTNDEQRDYYNTMAADMELKAQERLKKLNRYKAKANYYNSKISSYNRKISKIDPSYVAAGENATMKLLKTL